MSAPVVPVIPEIAQKAIDYGALAVNYIAFNPFGDQLNGGVRTARNVAKYSDIKPYLTKAIDMLEEHGIECNVRYLPLCMAEPRHRKNFYNYQQLSYDHHEWDYASWIWTMMQPQMMKDGGLVPPVLMGPGYRRVYKGDQHRIRDRYEKHPAAGKLALGAQHVVSRLNEAVRGKEELYREEARVRAEVDCAYKYHDACQQCALRNICDGFHGDYAEFFGTGEAEPVKDLPLVNDPKHYINEQDKFVEPEDESWAL
jgi:hypothetical protein